MKKAPTKKCKCLIFLARLEGFEPPTYGLEVRCSIQLSYRRTAKFFLNYLRVNVLPSLVFSSFRKIGNEIGTVEIELLHRIFFMLREKGVHNGQSCSLFSIHRVP